MLLKDIAKLSTEHLTSLWKLSTVWCKCLLQRIHAALHYNENSTRRIAVCVLMEHHNIASDTQSSRRGNTHVRSVKTKPTFDYARYLLKFLLFFHGVFWSPLFFILL